MINRSCFLGLGTCLYDFFAMQQILAQSGMGNFKPFGKILGWAEADSWPPRQEVSTMAWSAGKEQFRRFLKVVLRHAECWPAARDHPQELFG